jgi:dinuclear metal center YbgI/SA1388 family protein
MARLTEVVAFLDAELRTGEINDYPSALNGLQLANSGSVSHVAAAVDFSTAVVRSAAERKADLLILHHGIFWSGLTRIVGPRHEQLSTLLAGQIAVYSSHLPLDLHPRWGNNALLAREFGLVANGGFASSQGVEIGVRGTSDVATADLATRVQAFCSKHGHHLVTTPLAPGQRTARWGICSGAGASSDTIDEALSLGLDTIIVGEGPHHTAVRAADAGLTIFYAGHYATETPGVRAIADEVARQFSITSSFIESPTGL